MCFSPSDSYVFWKAVIASQGSHHIWNAVVSNPPIHAKNMLGNVIARNEFCPMLRLSPTDVMIQHRIANIVQILYFDVFVKILNCISDCELSLKHSSSK
jgi:hypothetical protein